MQPITPFLWFDDNAEEAVDFYVSVFDNAKRGRVMRYDEASSKASGRPVGSVLTVDFEIEGQKFGALNGGPIFKITPAISFFIRCKTEEEVDRVWNKLAEGGLVMMELAEYPFSKKYGWLADRFGVSWQVILEEKEQKIVPSLLFTQEKYGKAEEAINFYTSIFKNSNIIRLAKRSAAEAVNGEKEGTLNYALFTLNGQEFSAMESGGPHKFTFTEAVSFVVNCDTQEEIDHYWNALSASPEFEQCGWLKDKYGVSWQIVPSMMDEQMAEGSPEQSKRMMAAMLQMKKLDIQKLQDAFDGK